ncbi:hypothetical protein BH23GEM9_BH23GEM9_05250 [soil metagenome]
MACLAMELPRGRVRIRRVNDDALATLIRGLTDRAGIRRLLRHLGFTGPLRPARAPADIPRSSATLLCTRRVILTAVVVELRAEVETMPVHDVLRALHADDPVRHHLVIVVERGHARIAIACDALKAGPRQVVFEPAHVRASDVDVMRDLTPAQDENDTAAALRIMRALDRSRITDRFFRDVVATRDRVARMWTGLPRNASAERDALALLFLSRLMFLYFLQRRGLMNDDLRFLPHLLMEWRSRERRTTFFRTRLRTLFFGVLNRRPARRTASACELGALPYLNGGLFEAHRLELDNAGIDLGDDVIAHVFSELLEKYRFTTTDSADGDASSADVLGVDPEMLGRIFEGLMPGERRGRTGSFYTPAAVVDRIVTTALAQHLASRCGIDEDAVADALAGRARMDLALTPRQVTELRECTRTLRVLDPACGSGAFLLGALGGIATVRSLLDRLAAPSRPLRHENAMQSVDVRREIVAHTLHGVDLLEDAALICSLRLWLALIPQCRRASDVPPLPNLDRRIRQGDALVDPLDIGVTLAGRPLDTTAPPELRALLASLRPAADRYLSAGPETRSALRRELHRKEHGLARAWLSAFDAGLEWQIRDLAARAADRDLFGGPAAHAATAARHLRAARQKRTELGTFRQEVNGAGRLPFFSFRVHFADADDGFDVILSNPPWVRAHRWPPSVRSLLRERYRVCATAGWPYAAALSKMPTAAGAQVDLSLLFLEKSVRLLRDGGTLAMLLPAKLFRSLYAGGARELLLRDVQLTIVEDHSLDQRAVFDADAYTAVVFAQRTLAGQSDGSNAGRSDRAGPPRTDRTAVEPAAAPISASDASGRDVRVTLTRAVGPALEFAVPRGELSLRPGDARSPWLLVPPECRAVFRTMQRAGSALGESMSVRRGVMTGANDVLVVRDVAAKIGDLARIRTEGYYRAQSAQARATFSAYVEGSALRPALRGTDVSAWSVSTQRHVLWTPRNDDRSGTAPQRLRRYLNRHRRRLGRCGEDIGTLHRLSAHTLGHKVVWSDLASDLRAAAVPSSVRGVMGTDVAVVPLNTVYFVATSALRESLLLSAYFNSLPLRVFARAIAERAKDAHFRFFAWTIAVLPLPRDWRANAAADRLIALATDAHERGSLTAAHTTELDSLVAHSYGIACDELARLADFDEWLRGADLRTQGAA